MDKNLDTQTNPGLYSSIGRAGGLYPSDASSILAGGSCIGCDKPTNNPKFCSKSCAATYNNTKAPKRKRRVYVCKRCAAEILGSGKTYCSADCQRLAKRDVVVNAWLAGEDSGLSTIGTVKDSIKEWLRETRGNFCVLCGWDKVNPTTGKVPVVADHIDGNWKHNRPENLRLICPSCDSLQPTYKALNKHGRAWRRTV